MPGGFERPSSLGLGFTGPRYMQFDRGLHRGLSCQIGPISVRKCFPLQYSGKAWGFRA